MKRSVPTVLTLVACFALAGCGLSKGDLLPHSTPPVVKIGLVAPFERRYRTLGYEALHAVKWALRERNDRGGVAGAMVELVALNDGAEPAASAFQAHKLAVDPDVVGVIGPFTGDTLLAAAPIYEEQGLPAVTPAACPSSIAERLDGVICLGSETDRLAQALLSHLSDEVQVTLLRDGDGTLGYRLALTVQHVLEAPLDESTLSEMIAHPADAYLYDGDVLGAADVLTQMRRAGIVAPLWGGPSLARTQLPQIAERAVAGACYAIASPLFADQSPDSAFAAGYRERAGSPPGPWAALAYDAAQLLLDAIERDILAQGRATRSGVTDQLGEALGPDGDPVFAQELRKQPVVSFYCYRAGDAYPGHPSGSQ
jgi:branched-chain amino acid transport system substrate-binding protein